MRNRGRSAGAMAAYGPDYLDMGRRAAMLVDKLFKGQKPASLPIERADKFDLTAQLSDRQFHRFPPAAGDLKESEQSNSLIAIC